MINPIQINNINNIENNINNRRKKIKKKKKQRSKNITETSNENLSSKLNNQKIIEKINILRYTNNEKNLLTYNLAIQYDKKTYFEYYISLLRIKNNLIFSFFPYKDYNSQIIKVDIIFISFSIYYAVNCQFFAMAQCIKYM